MLPTLEQNKGWERFIENGRFMGLYHLDAAKMVERLGEKVSAMNIIRFCRQLLGCPYHGTQQSDVTVFDAHMRGEHNWRSLAEQLLAIESEG